MTGVEGSPASVETQDLLRLLPHRYPFLLVDRITDINGDVSCIGWKNVTINEPFFQGHFPGRPVMPGVLILEGMAQSAGAIVILSQGATSPFQSIYFITIDKAKFRRPVVPGDRLAFHMTRLARRKTMWWYRGEARVDGELACEAELGAMIAQG